MDDAPATPARKRTGLQPDGTFILACGQDEPLYGAAPGATLPADERPDEPSDDAG